MLRMLRGHQERREQVGLVGGQNFSWSWRTGSGGVHCRYMFVEINKDDASRELKAVDKLVCLGCKGEGVSGRQD